MPEAPPASLSPIRPLVGIQSLQITFTRCCPMAGFLGAQLWPQTWVGPVAKPLPIQL